MVRPVCHMWQSDILKESTKFLLIQQFHQFLLFQSFSCCINSLPSKESTWLLTGNLRKQSSFFCLNKDEKLLCKNNRTYSTWMFLLLPSVIVFQTLV